MTATQAYRDWLHAGKPYTLVRPARALVAALQAHGLTVYHYPNAAHLTASIPEDHTPFSATGWPAGNRRWLARGVDIMPRSDSYAHRKENADIARRIVADRNAGVPGVMWIKYVNWTDEHGVCRQERWTPNHTTRSSTDKGHIHISGRSDCDDDTRADGYDPLARTPESATTGDDDMSWGTDTLTQGSPGYAGHQHDTALAFAWQAAAEAKANTDKLLTAAQADADRDAAALAAIKALTDAVNAGGGSIDGAPIVAAVKAAGDESRAQYTAQLERIAELESELAAVREITAVQLSEAERATLDDAP